jgi:hypothetical protein
LESDQKTNHIEATRETRKRDLGWYYDSKGKRQRLDVQYPSEQQLLIAQIIEDNGGSAHLETIVESVRRVSPSPIFSILAS